ncbi:hypothetical protein DM773_17625 [Escherichia coli]|nr:hypothetical protein DM773_17625 [Escherichia coli]
MSRLIPENPYTSAGWHSHPKRRTRGGVCHSILRNWIQNWLRRFISRLYSIIYRRRTVGPSRILQSF